ncbi:TetR/AcrR family transcriptional regulator [Mucilaginibacter corticis]|uniref:TetR/AcrR family transcriptional regulator n=1 Tax=Mucilaginibacter corticis TaxID=2597670 RepID=A0A556MKV9_9SPHI|nr:TetR/AcrR family transcriptional regulator [Mucilaginibacter corticis]TSJ40508.1 TetR/AcrR family transcriptional regulator [Mucilaginibacter corticis]
MSRVITRQKIISDSGALFEQKGYLNVTIPEIEKATGKTKAVLYGYFENRQSLANAVLEHNLTQKRAQILRQAALQPDQIRKLGVHIDLHDPEKKSLIVVGNSLPNAVETIHAYEEMKRIAADALIIWHQDIVELINGGIKTGEFTIKSEPEELAWLLISLVEGALLISQTTQNAKLGWQLLNQAKREFLQHLTLSNQAI